MSKFKTAKLKTSSFNIFFGRVKTIKQYQEPFKEELSDKYNEPQLINIPDDLDPQVPRMVFESKNGFSRINISQVNMSLSVNYSPEWRTEFSQCEEYIKERINSLFRLLEHIDNRDACYCGLVSKVEIASNSDDSDLMTLLRKYCLKDTDTDEYTEIKVKKTRIVEEEFFYNETVSNFRAWEGAFSQQIFPRLPRGEADVRGIEIVTDFNDRYSYNENRSYYSSHEKAIDILTKGFEFTNQTVSNILGDINE